MRSLFNKFPIVLYKNNLLNKLVLSLIIICLALSIYTMISISSEANPSQIIFLILLDLIAYLALIIVSTRRVLFMIFKDYKTSRIRARIILLFSIIAAIPTIIISAFSIFMFNFAIQSWFDSNVSTAIDQSVRVSNLYIDENKLQLKDTALAMASDLNDLYYELIYNPLLFQKVLKAQSEMRGITEALVFQRSTNTVLAQTTLSFSLSFWTIPEHTYEKSSSGIVTDITTDPNKLRMLIKLREYDDIYLLVGRLVDEEITRYIDNTKGAANKYKEMRAKKESLQIQFGLTFLLISCTMITITILLGAIFANKISKPIRKLVKATELVQSGDLSVFVNIDQDREDELVILTNAFNKMVKRIDIQQKDLALAQRAMAWSDVARRVAHEIKNPLTPISLSADRILKKFLNEVSDQESFKKYISTIQRHTKDIQKIITEFGEFAKLPAPNFEQIELISTLKELVDSRQSINDKILYDFFSNTNSLNFTCDITQIHQVVVNLLKNAEEALDNIAGEKKINIEVNSSIEELEIIIRDNGKGFPTDLIDKVTEPYMTTRSKGSGLGLAIVKKIVQDHGGEIIISNHKSGGAEVKLLFDVKIINSKVKN